MEARMAPSGVMAAQDRGMQQMPPIDVYGRRPAAGAPRELPGASKAKGAGKGGQKAAPAAPPEDNWEGNFNYKITQMFDKLFGQDEAERGRRTQQYYEQNPY